jgi:hypothetical protein
MVESQSPRVQHLPRKIPGVLRAINLVAKNGMPDVMKVNSDLVCAAAVQLAFDQTHFIA